MDDEAIPHPKPLRNEVSNISSLSVLSDHSATARPWEDFLNHITLPRLSTLKITLSAPFPAPAFLSCISRSNCRITTLHLRGVQLDLSGLVSVLRAVPSVTTLSLREDETQLTTESPGTLALMIVELKVPESELEHPILPLLADLDLCWRYHPRDDAHVRRLIRSRLRARARSQNKGVVRLRTIVLGWMRACGIGETFLAELQDYGREGLGVAVI
jgi:hypothetical protein